MDNIYKKIENELSSLSSEERLQIMEELRKEIDKIDEKLVRLLSRRSLHAVLIGRVKRTLNLPTYNPEREKQIADRISSFLESPLSKEALIRIYERIIDEARVIQKDELEKGVVYKIPEMKSKLSLKNIFSRKDVLIVISFFVILLSIFYYTFFTSNYYNGNSPKVVDIKKGETLTEIADDLYEKNIIPSKANFKIASFIYGAEKNIKAGRFHIPNGLSYLDLLDLLISGKANFLKTIKIYNGKSDEWIGGMLKNEVLIDSSAFVELTKNKPLLDSLGIKAPSIEGYLLPRQYLIYEYSSPREALDSIYTGFQNFMNDSLMQKVNESKYTLHELLTLASIVQGETNKVEEMPLIAGVYFNRLRIGMKLQADPTIQYIVNNKNDTDGKWRRILYDDLKTDSPYNTYKYAGLPPNPINNPGKSAILAVLYPEKNDYYYFVADGNGGHKFAKNFSQHIRLVREYRRWLKSQTKN